MYVNVMMRALIDHRHHEMSSIHPFFLHYGAVLLVVKSTTDQSSDTLMLRIRSFRFAACAAIIASWLTAAPELRRGVSAFGLIPRTTKTTCSSVSRRSSPPDHDDFQNVETLAARQPYRRASFRATCASALLVRRQMAASRQQPSKDPKKLSQADKDRLLMSEVGLTAFIVAEMRHFCNQTVVEFDQGQRFETKWTMSLDQILQMGLAQKNIIDKSDKDEEPEEEIVYDAEYAKQSANMTANEAVDLICDLTQTAFAQGYSEPGLLSALGSAILYFRDFYRTPAAIAACERIGLSDYAVAHHVTDMYHHRTFRGAYTKTLAASGSGEIAAAVAVGLMDAVEAEKARDGKGRGGRDDANPQAQSQSPKDEERDADDECLQWSPTTPGLCLHWKSDNEKWRKTRFERIQMEGTKDPRRGGSGTTR